jgi:retinol-binding protein 3
MATRSFLGALLFVLPVLAFANGSGPSISNTPAGRALAVWLDAFNSGDRARIEAFDESHAPWLTVNRAMALRARTGGYELLSIDQRDDLWIMFRAREKANSQEVIGRLVVKSDNPAVINWMLFDTVSPGAEVQRITLDAAERDRVIEGAARLLDQRYVFPDVGKKMSAALRKAEKRGTYRAIADGQILAWRLSDDLWVVAHDGHLGVRFSKEVLPPDGPDQGAGPDQAARQRLLAGNCGFEKAEHLAPNIGYLKFDEFADPAICAPTAAAAMNFLAEGDALIIDLRDNHGGGAMVDFIASYLFAEPTHLTDIYTRQGNATKESWTLPYVPGKRFLGKPVFVLTSKRTFSAAEAFCYGLKTLKRAVLVGETTGGGAHLMDLYRIDDHFSIAVPTGRSISPITNTDWEGTGIEPDVKVAATDALDEALRRAREQATGPGSPR